MSANQNVAVRRILIVGEGKHEEGGALTELVRRILSESKQCTFEFMRWKTRPGGNRRFRFNGKGDGITKKCVSFAIDAKACGYDAIIVLIDRDGVASRTKSMDAAQDQPLAELPHAFGIAIETFDAWFLADEHALSAVLRTRIDRQANPESNRNAKRTIAALQEDSETALGLSECYAGLAPILDLDTVSARCPQGFAVWRNRVALLIGRLPQEQRSVPATLPPFG